MAVPLASVVNASFPALSAPSIVPSTSGDSAGMSSTPILASTLGLPSGSLLSSSSLQAGQAGRWRVADYVADSELGVLGGLARIDVDGSVLGGRLGFGDVKVLHIGGDLTESSLSPSTCEVQNLDRLRIGGLLSNSTVSVGVNPGSDGFFDGDETGTGGALGRARIGGAVQDRLGDPYGIIADELLHTIRIGGTIVRRDGLPWSSGNVRVVVV